LGLNEAKNLAESDIRDRGGNSLRRRAIAGRVGGYRDRAAR
jgi:hypothetical protein